MVKLTITNIVQLHIHKDHFSIQSQEEGFRIRLNHSWPDDSVTVSDRLSDPKVDTRQEMEFKVIYWTEQGYFKWRWVDTQTWVSILEM